MPRHDPEPSSEVRRRLAERRGIIKQVAERLRAERRRRHRRPGDDGETVIVDPARPLDLTGGAAAALEFDK